MRSASKKIDISKAELNGLYVVKKLSSVEIGKVFKCHASTVRNRLREFGISVRTLREAHKDILTKEQIRNILRRRIPSSLEKEFQGIVDKHSLPYKYVGNGKFFVERLNPDFINTNSEKIAVEVFARYYKLKRPESIEEWKKKRAQVFKSYGWKLLFFNEIQVNEDYVLKVLKSKKAKEA